MSDSEEFMSAEEDYEEIEYKSNIKVNVSKDVKEKKKDDQEKTKKDLKIDTIKHQLPFIEKEKDKVVKLKDSFSTKVVSGNLNDILNANVNRKGEAQAQNENRDESDEMKNTNLPHDNTIACQKEETCSIENLENQEKLNNLVKPLEVLEVTENKFCKTTELNIQQKSEKLMSSQNKCETESSIKSSSKNDKIKAEKQDTQLCDESNDKKENISDNIDVDSEDNWDFDDWKTEETPILNDEKQLPNYSNIEISSVETKDPQEDNWNFDEWGEIKEEPIKHQDQKVSLKLTETKETEQSGWDDFDDDEWINTNEINRNVEENIKDPFKPKQELKNMEKKYKSDKIQSQHQEEGIPNSFENLAQGAENTIPWNGWKPWGGVVTSLLSTATEGVTSLTTHVSQVLESSMGIPEPEELLKMNQKFEEKQSNAGSDYSNEGKSDEKKEEISSTFIGIVSGVTTIGNKVIAGGLDTLEGIGKKTMNILQENDPLLLNKRRIIGLESNKPNLSQVLREAKEKSEEIEKNLKHAQKQYYKKQLHFETLFDHYYGLVHLEALEMLSKQCDIKIQSLMNPLSGKALEEIKETLNEVKELCELDEIETDDHDEFYNPESLKTDLKIATQDFGIPTDFSEITECWQKNLDYLKENTTDSQDVFEKGLRCLAETCALQMNKMHKIAELLIIKESHSTVNEADSLVQITNIFSRHLKGIANKFGEKLNTFEQTEEVKTAITNIFLEVYNSTSYVQSAFKLFIPILQVGAA